MTFSEYFTILHRRWRVWGAGLVLGVLAATAYNAVAPVAYTATATSFVTMAERGDQGEIFQASQFAVQRVKSYSGLSQSPEVLRPVMGELDLHLSETELRRSIEVSSPPETVLLEVSVSHPSARMASAAADLVSERMGELIEELETGQGAEESAVKVSMVEPATLPRDPSSPRTLLNLVLGVLVGFVLGFTAAIVRHHLDRRIKGDEAVRTITGMSPLGSTLHERDARSRPLVALDHRSVSAERYRTVRTALKFATVDHELRHFAITSALAGEGKTTVACNLAISWSQTASVCLVEADLRRPGVSRMLGLEGSVGLTDVLLEEVALDDVLVPWHDNRVSVLPAGSLPPDPTALLGSGAMQTLVRTLRQRFDVVIYDAPPLLSVTDATVLSEMLDGLVLVARWGRTSRDDLRAATDLVQRDRLRLLGTIVSGTRDRGALRRAYYASDVSGDRVELPPLGAERQDDLPSQGRNRSASPLQDSIRRLS